MKLTNGLTRLSQALFLKKGVLRQRKNRCGLGATAKRIFSGGKLKVQRWPNVGVWGQQSAPASQRVGKSGKRQSGKAKGDEQKVLRV